MHTEKKEMANSNKPNEPYEYPRAITPPLPTISKL